MTLVIVMCMVLLHIYLCVFCFIIGSCFAVLLKEIQVIRRHTFGTGFFHLYSWSLDFRHTFSAFVHLVYMQVSDHHVIFCTQRSDVYRHKEC
jgi:hypothetical protein